MLCLGLYIPNFQAYVEHVPAQVKKLISFFLVMLYFDGIVLIMKTCLALQSFYLAFLCPMVLAYTQHELTSPPEP